MSKYLADSFYAKTESALLNSAPSVGDIKTMRTQIPADHGRWHKCANPNSEEPRSYSKVDYPLLFAAIGTRMNPSITDPGFNDTTHFAGLFTQLGDTYDDYHDFIYVDDV